MLPINSNTHAACIYMAVAGHLVLAAINKTHNSEFKTHDSDELFTGSTALKLVNAPNKSP